MLVILLSHEVQIWSTLMELMWSPLNWIDGFPDFCTCLNLLVILPGCVHWLPVTQQRAQSEHKTACLKAVSLFKFNFWVVVQIPGPGLSFRRVVCDSLVMYLCSAAGPWKPQGPRHKQTGKRVSPCTCSQLLNPSHFQWCSVFQPSEQ